jgi:hypothetical protein
MGIPADALDRVFDRSFQVEREGRTAEGSGIGLSIVKQILDSHGCTIHAQSVLGEGTRFRFTVPLSPQGTQTPSKPQPGPQDSRSRPVKAPSEPHDAPKPRFRIIRPEPSKEH